jgi:hypothetical protein
LLELREDELRVVAREELPLLREDLTAGLLLLLEPERLTLLRLGAVRFGAEYRLLPPLDGRGPRNWLLLPLDGRVPRTWRLLPDERTVRSADRVEGRVTVVLRVRVVRLGV